jgi:hypothetical protein
MAEPASPGEPGYDPDSWFQHVIYVGLKIARITGLGLGLFNGLRSRFAGVARDILGAASTLIGQGVRAAATWNAAGPDHVVDVDALPLAPKGFFGPEEVDRIVGMAESATVSKSGGPGKTFYERPNFPEDWSKAAVEDALETALQDQVDESDPDLIIDKQNMAHMVWIGKRF